MIYLGEDMKSGLPDIFKIFGGGVMIYLSNQIRATRRQKFEFAYLERICIWIEIDIYTFS